MRPRREDKNRSVNERILILCEGGKTEPNYFNGIKRDKAISNRLAALRIHVHHTKKNTAKELIAEAVELIKEAKEEKNPYNSSWIIVDRDGYTKHPEAFDRARAHGIHVSFSSPCFEYWILLHFEYTTSPFTNCEEVIGRLSRFMQGYAKAGDHYSLLKGSIGEAIARGERIIAHQNEVGTNQIWTSNPYSDVGILVSKLINL
jgi:hypothetical protein